MSPLFGHKRHHLHGAGRAAAHEDCAPAGRARQLLGVAVALVLALLTTGTAAAEVSFRAEVNAHRLGVQDVLQLTVTLEGRSIDLKEEIAPPQLTNLRLAGGPSVSTQISFVNGQISQAKSYTYILQPIAVGSASIGPVSASLGDGVRSTQPIAVEVVDGSILQQQRRSADPFASFFRDDPFDTMAGRRRAAPQGKILVAAIPSRTTMHVGEPLLLTYYLYTQSAIAGIDFEQAPSYAGFWSEDLPRTEEQSRGEVVEYQGERFNRFAVFRKLLYPTKSGSVTIPASTFRIGTPRGGGFFLDPLPGAGAVISRSTAPITVQVLPLPDAEGFQGAVGRLKVTASADRQELSLGEAATVRLHVEGSGNLKWIEQAPALSIPGAKVYPPQVSSNLTATPTGLRGSKTWEYVVVPETSGNLTVPPISFPYFDPSAQRIVHAATSPITLAITGAGGAAPAIAAAPLVATTSPAAGGLRLRSDLELPSRALPAIGGGLLALLTVLALLAHGLLWGTPHLAAALRPGSGGTASHRSARSALADIARASRGGLSKEAAAALIEKAVTDVFGSLDELSGAPTDERDRDIREVLMDVRFIRYAPQLGEYGDKIREVAARAKDVIRRWA